MRPWCLMEVISRREIIDIVTDAFTETEKIGVYANIQLARQYTVTLFLWVQVSSVCISKCGHLVTFFWRYLWLVVSSPKGLMCYCIFSFNLMLAHIYVKLPVSVFLVLIIWSSFTLIIPLTNIVHNLPYLRITKVALSAIDFLTHLAKQDFDRWDWKTTLT